jgi:Holliday junction resolvase
MSKAKQKGTLAESAVVDYLKQFWPAVERRVLSGKNDKGDITGISNIAIEIKNQKSYKIHEWLKETQVEKINAEADFGILLIKPNGVGVSRVQDWWTVIPLSDLVELLQRAGYVEDVQTQTDRGH